MSNLDNIATRHGRDRWKDALFVGVAALLILVSIGSVTSTAIGKTSHHVWNITVIEDPLLISR